MQRLWVQMLDDAWITFRYSRQWALGLVRAKGLMRDLDGQPRALQLVGARAAVTPSAHPRPEDGRLVCIGLRGQLDRASIEATVRRCRVNMETPMPHQG